MGTINGWLAVGRGGYKNEVMRVKSMVKMGNDFCPYFLQPLLDNVDRKSCNDGNRIQYFTTLTDKAGPLFRRWLLSWNTCRGALLNHAELGGVQIHIQFFSGYLKGGNQVSPKSLAPLQGMKAHPLRSLFVWEVTIVSYQPCSQSLNSL